MTKKFGGFLVKLICVLLTLAMTFAMLAGCHDDDGESSKDKDKESVEVGGNGGKKKVALTFDDGPNYLKTPLIVDELTKYGYNATFFVVGNLIKGGNAEALAYAYEAGNEIGIHGYTHEVYYDECSDAEYEEELSKTKDAIKAVVPNANVQLMRPVGGYITDERVKTCPYSVIMWSVDSRDYEYTYKKGDTEDIWNQKVNTIVDNIMSQVEEGDIILMHDIYESTYDAVVVLLARLHEEGYEVVTVSELLNNPSSGKKFSHAGQSNNDNAVG